MRKLMMAAVAVAGLAAATGCQRKSDVQEQREEVAKAQQDVSEAQRDAHEKVAEQANEGSQETAEARQEAGKEVAEAQQNLNEEQGKLTEEQREEQADRTAATAGATTVQGSLQSKGDDLFVLTVPDQNNRQLRLKTDDQTRLMQNNREVKLDDIQEGSQVRASYVAEGNDMVARDVTVVTPAPKK